MNQLNLTTFISDKIPMSSIKYIEEIYQIVCEAYGPKEARLATHSIVSLAIDEVLEGGLPFTEENLSQKLQLVVEDFRTAAKNRVA